MPGFERRAAMTAPVTFYIIRPDEIRLERQVTRKPEL